MTEEQFVHRTGAGILAVGSVFRQGSFKGDTGIDIEVDVEGDVDLDRYFGY